MYNETAKNEERVIILKEEQSNLIGKLDQKRKNCTKDTIKHEEESIIAQSNLIGESDPKYKNCSKETA